MHSCFQGALITGSSMSLAAQLCCWSRERSFVAIFVDSKH